MGCNDYNLHLDNSEGNESPTPEFKIYLDGVGVNGYSPTIEFTPQTSDQFYITVNDINGIHVSPDGIPKMSYLTSNYVSNTSLASTLTDYSTTSEIASTYLTQANAATTYLKVDGSNADNPITINGFTLADNPNIIRMRSASKDICIYSETGKVYYGTNNNSSKELATVGDIPEVSNATITLTQGGATKGTFTLNGSATTIDLDAGGSTITNPLTIGYTNSNTTYNLNLGVNETTTKIISSYTINTEGSSLPPYIAPIRLLTNTTNPLVLTENQDGLYNLSLNIDSDTLEVNQDGELTVVGGGGTTYTAGTGIDITSDVISIDTDVVAQLSDIPDVSDFVTNSSLTTTLSDYVQSSSLGSAAYTASTDYATVAQGTLADTAIQPGDLATVATTGSYNDLLNKPTIPSTTDLVTLNTTQTITGSKTFSGSGSVYLQKNLSLNNNGKISLVTNSSGIVFGVNNLLSVNSSDVRLGYTGKPISINGQSTRPSYTDANNTTTALALYSDIPSLTGYATETWVGNQGYLTSSDISDMATQTWVGQQGYITGITSSDVTTALGYTPYDSSNPNGYTSNVGTVTAVNNISPDSDGNVTISIPSGGLQNTATGTNSLTILGIPTTNDSSIAIGDSSNAKAEGCVAIGYLAQAGDSNSSYGSYSVSIGLAAGYGTNADCTVAIGREAKSYSYGGIAIGNRSDVGGSAGNGIAIGDQAEVRYSGSIQLGSGINSLATSLCVGFDNTSVGGSVQNNWLLLDGATGKIPQARLDIETLLSTIYPVGAIYISTTSTCPLASLMPNATWTKVSEDRVLQGSSTTNTAGTTLAAGLPNITGTLNNVNMDAINNPWNGALSSTYMGGETGYRETGSGPHSTINFDASYSNSIYGNSSTVQPPAYVVSIWERTA